MILMQHVCHAEFFCLASSNRDEHATARPSTIDFHQSLINMSVLSMQGRPHMRSDTCVTMISRRRVRAGVTENDNEKRIDVVWIDSIADLGHGERLSASADSA